MFEALIDLLGGRPSLSVAAFVASCAVISALSLRRSRADALSAALFAFAIHVGLYLAVAEIEAPKQEPASDGPVRYEIVHLPPPPPAREEPKPAPPEAKPPPPEAEPPPPDPAPTKPRRRAPRPRRPEPAATPSPAPSPEPVAPRRIELPASQLGGRSGVVITAGTSALAPGLTAGGGGRAPQGRSQGRTGSGDGGGERAQGRGSPDWVPASTARVRRLPRPIRVPVRTCPATRSDDIQGTVRLKVQVRASGRVRKVSVTQGIGHGCDEVARDALRAARFEPAVTTSGSSADYEIEYEYVFTRA